MYLVCLPVLAIFNPFLQRLPLSTGFVDLVRNRDTTNLYKKLCYEL